jgi:hypothetical protein
MQLNTLLTLRFAGGAEYPSRLESVSEDGMWAAAAPMGLPLDAAPTPGTHLELSWGERDGVCRMPVEYAGTGVVNVRVWWLRPTGEIDRHQRRAFVRVTVVIPATLSHPKAEAVCATVVDISEGGLCITVPESQAGGLETGMWVQVRDLALENATVTVDAEVVRISAAYNEKVKLGLRTTPSRGVADQIRRFVLNRQRWLRQQGLFE